jgi:hypothetical protein
MNCALKCAGDFKMEKHRQGDLLFVKVDGIPAEAKAVSDGIIARGESTGHMHRLSQGSKAALMVAAGVQYIMAMQEEANIVHEEHGMVVLPMGNWQVKRQREYRPDGWVRVAD